MKAYTDCMKQQARSLQRQRLSEYIDKLENQESLYSSMMREMESQFIAQAESLIRQRFAQLERELPKLKRGTEEELLTLRYFRDRPQEKGSLFALFRQVQEKLDFNSSIIQSTTLTLTLPHPSPASLAHHTAQRHLKLYEALTAQLRAILSSETVRKYCKKEAEAAEKAVAASQKLLENAKETLYCTQVSIKKPFEEGLAELAKYGHVQTLSLSLSSAKGTLQLAQYGELVSGLLANRFFLRRLEVRVMDMEFSQEKADLLRRRLPAELPRLQEVRIINYYRECKLGEFEDFNWHPYRKKVNVTSGVW